MLLALALALMSPTTPVNNAADAVVQVLCADGSGSAVHVGNGKYLSVAHVTEMTSCTVEGESIIDIKPAGNNDFSTFRGKEIAAKAKTSCSGFSAGETYLAIGYAFGWPQQTRNPWTASQFRLNGYQAFTGEAIPGMSGGAVIDDGGRVVGVINMRWPARSLALKDSYVCK